MSDNLRVRIEINAHLELPERLLGELGNVERVLGAWLTEALGEGETADIEAGAQITVVREPVRS